MKTKRMIARMCNKSLTPIDMLLNSLYMGASGFAIGAVATHHGPLKMTACFLAGVIVATVGVLSKYPNHIVKQLKGENDE